MVRNLRSFTIGIIPLRSERRASEILVALTAEYDSAWYQAC
jgi:hypothetical protein